MKSTESQLKSRGKITDKELLQYSKCTKISLLNLLKSTEAFERTIAVKLLSEKYDLDGELTRLFLQTLKKEKKLYTRIELCNALSKGDIQSAQIIVEYVGQIGNNQHTTLPVNGFNKKSYPLPRDIVARTLAHMKVDILPVLMDVLKTNNILVIREVIDAIGFICFYNKMHFNTKVIDGLTWCFRHQIGDDIVRWKLVRAFGSFNDTNIIKMLTDIEQNDCQWMIRNEATRSLRIINGRDKGNKQKKLSDNN